MTPLVAVVVTFIVVGIVFLATNLLVGRLVRPARPTEQKGEVYECGERPIGSAWIQFDLRFYVVALLFVIFDVEIAFFFPWAVVFGNANQLADPNLTVEKRTLLESNFDVVPRTAETAPVTEPHSAKAFARFAFLELLVFFGILLVGFAYLWNRGDLEWVRSVASQIRAERKLPGPPTPGMER